MAADPDYYQPDVWLPFRCEECGQWVNGSQAVFWAAVCQWALCEVAEDMTATDGDPDVFRDEVTYLLTIGRP
jgi:hypothetical protein